MRKTRNLSCSQFPWNCELFLESEPDMQLTPYWQATAPRFHADAAWPQNRVFDVAVIGGGFTGLSAARVLAGTGARVVVLEANHIGAGGSGRNGGHLNNGLAHSFVDAKAHFGLERAKELYRAFDASIDTIETVIEEEGIACDFRRSGKLKIASKPTHYDALARNFEAVNRDVDPDTSLLDRSDLGAEILTDQVHGGMLFKKSAMMHMGRFVAGLAEAARRRGAVILEDAPVTGRKQSRTHSLSTPRGIIEANDILLATGAYTTGPFDYFRRRVIPIASYIIATRPLTDAEIAATMPGRRTYVTSRNIGHYFRLSPDNRLLFGGRARFSARSDPQADQKAAGLLKKHLADMFPVLADVQIDYCWGGMVGMTRDRFPRAGFADGMHFSMGYSGHGAQIATHMGVIMAEIIAGKRDRNPWKGLPWAAVPGYSGKPWFLPLVGAYYGLLDRVR